jgi:hypothetical protein
VTFASLWLLFYAGFLGASMTLGAAIALFFL